MLPACLHAVCRSCADLELNGTHAAFTCPRCGEPVDRGSLLDVHPLIEAEAEAAAAAAAARPTDAHAAAGAQRCSECPAVDDREHDGNDDDDVDTLATTLCTTCEQVFCDAHASLHRRFGKGKGHTLAALMPPPPPYPASANASPLLCSSHQRPLEAYCTTCGEAVCVGCLATAHAKHDVVLLDDRVVAAQRAAMDVAATSAQHAVQRAVTRMLDARAAVDDVEANAAAVADQIRAAFAALQRLLEQRRDRLLDDLGARKAVQVEAYRALESDTRRLWTIAASTLALSERLRAPDNAAATVVRLAPTATARLVQISSTVSTLAAVPAPSPAAFAISPHVADLVSSAGVLETLKD